LFDDLIKKKTTGFNTKMQCPHCRTFAIVKHAIQGLIDGKRKQEAYCPSCKRRWYIVHDQDMKGAHVQYINLPAVPVTTCLRT